MLLESRVLVLSSSYEAINICSAKRALIMIFKGVAQMVEQNGRVVHSPSISIEVPEVIKLNRYIRLPYKDITFCKKNVFLRDNHTCQYCGKKVSSSDLTVDHVIPISKGGRDYWENVVTACAKCNHKKGDQLPEDIDLFPARRPKKPSSATYLHLVRHLGQKKEKWRKYLFFEEFNLTEFAE